MEQKTFEDILPAVRDIVDKSTENLAEMPNEQYLEYLNAAARISEDAVFQDLLTQIAKPVSETILYACKTMDEVVSHRSVLLAIQMIREKLDELARAHAELTANPGTPGDIIPNK